MGGRILNSLKSLSNDNDRP